MLTSGPAKVVDTRGVDIREAPNVNARLIRRLQFGEQVVVTESNGAGWLHLASGGWVCSTCPEFPATSNQNSPPWIRPR